MTTTKKERISTPCIVCGATCQAEISRAGYGVSILKPLGDAWIVHGGMVSPQAPKKPIVCSDGCRVKLLNNDEMIGRLGL